MNRKCISWSPSNDKDREAELNFLKKVEQRMMVFGHFDIKDVRYTIAKLQEGKEVAK